MSTLVNETMVSAPTTGTYLNSGSITTGGWNSGTSSFITNDNVNQWGNLEYTGTITAPFTSTADFQMSSTSGADGQWFYWGASTTPHTEGDAIGGYMVFRNDFSNTIGILFNGSYVTSTVTYTKDTLFDTFQVAFSGTTITVTYKGSVVIAYTDIARTLGGTKYGWGSRSGGASAVHSMKNLLLTDAVGTTGILFDASSHLESYDYLAGPANYTWAHTTGSGSNRLLVVTAALWQDTAGTGTMSAVTYNGVALTYVNRGNSGPMEADLWYLINPPTGTFNIVATVDGYGTDSRRFGAASFTGVDQTTPLNTSTTSATTTGAPSASVTTTTANALIIDVVSRYSATALTPSGGQTQFFNTSGGGSYSTTLGAGSYKIAGAAGSQTMSWTGSATQNAEQVIAAFSPVATVTVNTAAFFAYF